MRLIVARVAATAAYPSVVEPARCGGAVVSMLPQPLALGGKKFGALGCVLARHCAPARQEQR
jgi:hypothetical protein